jgi:hypothetical protein
VRNATGRGAAKGCDGFFSQKRKEMERRLRKTTGIDILHEHQTKDSFITKRVGKGLGEFKEHMKNVHGFVPVESAAKKPKEPVAKKVNFCFG